VRLGIIGYGAIAAIHASVLVEQAGIEVSVWGPDPARSTAFGRAHGVKARRRLRDLLGSVDAVIVASPSAMHQRQAAVALGGGIATLVEMPACRSRAAGRRLARIADRGSVLLRGTHTSRFLAPYRAVESAIRDGMLGDIQRVTYRRDMSKQSRSWEDDALRHHAQHPLDLFASWFGMPLPIECDLRPGDGPVREVTARLALPSGGTASIEVRYAATSQVATLRLEGTKGTVETDGFAWLQHDREDPMRWDARETYRDAVRSQDEAFLAACRGEARIPGSPDWTETLRVAGLIDRLAAISTRADG
jgi:2-hydroxy-4-carboxymuconate semialdehyde hemiacetal dehydrogenase